MGRLPFYLLKLNWTRNILRLYSIRPIMTERKTLKTLAPVFRSITDILQILIDFSKNGKKKTMSVENNCLKNSAILESVGKDLRGRFKVLDLFFCSHVILCNFIYLRRY